MFLLCCDNETLVPKRYSSYSMENADFRFLFSMLKTHRLCFLHWPGSPSLRTNLAVSFPQNSKKLVISTSSFARCGACSKKKKKGSCDELWKSLLDFLKTTFIYMS